MTDLPEQIIDFFNHHNRAYGGRVYLDGQLMPPPALPDKIAPRQKTVSTPVAPKPVKSRVSKKIPPQRSPELQQFYTEIKDCTACALCETRKNFVFGVGHPQARLMLIGEAPGQDEDASGIPFVGRAGKLLDKMLYAIGLQRDDIYIANILKCRPPQNRDPLPDEIVKCEPYLHQQIELIKPNAILALGRVAGQNLLKTDAALSALRTSIHQYKAIPMLVTYHPAALLRNPRWKENAWQDLKNIKKIISMP